MVYNMLYKIDKNNPRMVKFIGILEYKLTIYDTTYKTNYIVQLNMF